MVFIIIIINFTIDDENKKEMTMTISTPEIRL